MKNNDLTSLFSPLLRTIRRYNLTIFIVIVVAGLATAISMLNSALQQSSDTNGYTSALDITTFDQTTIERVKQLRTSSEAAPEFDLPPGRINPFTE